MRRSSQGRHRGGLLVGLFAVVVLGSTACSGTGAIRPGLPVMKVSERDFRVKAPRDVRAGELRIHVDNQGPDTHELLVVRFAGTRLPLRPDGFTVNEDALKSETAVVLEGSERGRHREAVVHLAPGRYVLFCNMAGHYLGGMHTVVTVR